MNFTLKHLDRLKEIHARIQKKRTGNIIDNIAVGEFTPNM